MEGSTNEALARMTFLKDRLFFSRMNMLITVKKRERQSMNHPNTNKMPRAYSLKKMLRAYSFRSKATMTPRR